MAKETASLALANSVMPPGTSSKRSPETPPSVGCLPSPPPRYRHPQETPGSGLTSERTCTHHQEGWAGAQAAPWSLHGCWEETDFSGPRARPLSQARAAMEGLRVKQPPPRASSAGPPRAPPGSVLLSSGEGGRRKAGPFGCLAYICLREEHQLSRVLFDSASGAAWCPSHLLRQPTVRQETSRSGRCPSPGSCGLVPAVPVGLCGMALRVRVTTEIPESPANRIVSALPSPGG